MITFAVVRKKGLIISTALKESVNHQYSLAQQAITHTSSNSTNISRWKTQKCNIGKARLSKNIALSIKGLA